MKNEDDITTQDVVEQNAALRKQVAELETKHAKQASHIRRLEANARNLSDASQGDDVNEITQLRAQVAQLEGQNTRVTQRRDDLSRENEQLYATKKRLIAKNEELEAQVATLLKTSSTAAKIKAEAESGEQESPVMAGLLNAKFVHENAQLRERNEQLDRQVTDLMDANARLTDKGGDAEQDALDQGALVQKLTKQLEDKTSTLQEMMVSRNTYANDLHQAEANVESLTDEVARLKATNADIGHKHEEAKSNLDVTKASLAGVTRERDAYVDELDAKVRELAKLQEESVAVTVKLEQNASTLQQIAGQRDEQAEAARKHQATIGGLQRDLDIMTNQRNAAYQSVSDLRDAQKALEDEHGAAEEAIKRLNAQLSELQQSIADGDANVISTHLQKQNSAVGQQLVEAEEARDAAREELYQARNALHKEERKVIDLEEQLHATADELSVYQSGPNSDYERVMQSALDETYKKLHIAERAAEGFMDDIRLWQERHDDMKAQRNQALDTLEASAKEEANETPEEDG